MLVELKELWDEYQRSADDATEAGKKYTSDLKADYDFLKKAAAEIDLTYEAYRKAHFQFTTQYEEFKSYLKGALDLKDFNDWEPDPTLQSRIRIRIKDPRELVIRRKVERVHIEILERHVIIRDMREIAVQRTTVEYEGAKRSADLALVQFNRLKDTQKRTEMRHKQWGELKDKIEKAFSEQKYETAYVYLWELLFKVKSKAPKQPEHLLEGLRTLWKELHDKKAESRESKRQLDRALGALDADQKKLDERLKQGISEVIRELEYESSISSAR